MLFQNRFFKLAHSKWLAFSKFEPSAIFNEFITRLSSYFGWKIQGVSYWTVSFKMALTDRKMEVRICLKVSVYSWGLEIWVSSTSFRKSNIDWPQQPLTEKVPYISKILGFWWSIQHKRFGIGHFDAIDDQTIRIRKFFEEIGL